MAKGKKTDWILKASEEYSLGVTEDNIYPISIVDGDIMKRLIGILNERGDYSDLAGILVNYKKVEDNVILAQLLEYVHQDFDDYIEIGDHIFKVFMLLSVRPVERIDRSKKQIKKKYSILVNEGPLPTSSEWKADTYIDFETEEKRNEELTQLKEKLQNFRNVRFL